MSKIRIFVNEAEISLGGQLKISNSDFEYLTKVMRQKVGNQIFVFNGNNGEFTCEIIQIEKKFLLLEVKNKISELQKTANITLAFALVKNVRIDFIATKATELGVRSFQPILTQRTIIDKINLERFRANVKEACEQCQRNDFPQIFVAQKLEKFLSTKESAEKIFILCDESKEPSKAGEVLTKITKNFLKSGQEIVILVGPEGGFCEAEFARMHALKNLHSISLGPRILRADTAIISALTLVQEFCG